MKFFQNQKRKGYFLNSLFKGQFFSVTGKNHKNTKKQAKTLEEIAIES